MRKLFSSARLDGRLGFVLAATWLVPLALAACSRATSGAPAAAALPVETRTDAASVRSATGSPAAATADAVARPESDPGSAGTATGSTAPPGAAGAGGDATGIGAQVTGAPATATTSAVPALASAPLEFLPQARALYRLVVCGSDDPIPAGLDRAAVDAHCVKMDAAVDKFRGGWLASARPFLAKLRPAGLPDRVVYPFGGGDLMWALITYPDAVEYTTISLEPAGDPRGVEEIDRAKLAASYRVAEKNVRLQLKVSHSRTDNLTVGARDALPSELILDLTALRVHGMEPVAMRYFLVADSGELEYLTKEQLDATPRADQAALFQNVELAFRAVGRPDAPVKVLRHVAFDLSDVSLTRHPGLLRHLEAKGKVAAITKAASYLLWSSAFGKVRDYLLASMSWMISDSTGVPPTLARAAGFVQDTYGRFETPFLPGVSRKTGEELATLWRSQPHRDLPIIYGYPDGNHHWHLMVTRPMSAAERAAAQAAPAALAPAGAPTAADHPAAADHATTAAHATTPATATTPAAATATASAREAPRKSAAGAGDDGASPR